MPEQQELTARELLAGPAAPGQVLRYVRLCGDGALYDRPQQRGARLSVGIGSPDVIAFMRGLELLAPTEIRRGSAVLMTLTERGEALYELLRDTDAMPEADASPEELYRQLHRCASGLYERYRAVFCTSRPAEVLRECLDAHGGYYPDGKCFAEQYADAVRLIYPDGGEDDRAAEACVSGLLSHCLLFRMAEERAGAWFFDRAALRVPQEADFSAQRAQERQELADAARTAEELSGRFGAERSALRDLLLDGGEAQARLRRALGMEQGSRCALCGLSVPELLRVVRIDAAADDLPDVFDGNNALLLCAAHEALFSAGLISFGDDGALMASQRLTPQERAQLGVLQGSGLEHRLMTARRRRFLSAHRMRFLQSEEPCEEK